MVKGIPSSLIELDWSEAWKPRDRRPIYEWAKENVFLQPPLTRTGPFDVTLSRQFIAPFDALQNDRVREVNVLAPVRDGKTLIADVWLPWLVANAPGPFRWVFQDEKAAEDQEEHRCKPILRNVPGFGPFIPDRGRITEIAGMVVAIDGPALGNLQSRGYRYMVCDEPWLWDDGRLEEAKARQKDFRKLQNNKILVISQGGEAGGDWDRQFRSGIIHEWNVQCQGCGKYIQPMWTGFRPDGSRWGMAWDEKKDAQGFWDIPKAVPTARFNCAHCGFSHIDTPRLKTNWNLTGKAIAEDTDKSDAKLSFRWPAIISYSFTELVELFLNAMNQLKTGNPTALIQFFQKQMAEMANEQTVFQDHRSIATAAYEINSDWKDEDGRAMTVDCQEEGKFYAVVRAVSKRARQARRLWRGWLYSEADIEKKREEFKIEPINVLVDSGYKAKGPGGVYAMCIRNGWVAVKGVGTVTGQSLPEGFWHTVEVGGGRTIKVLRSYSEPAHGDPETGVTERAILIKFSSDHVADALDGLIESGFWIEPEDDGSPDEKFYRRGMVAEYKKTKKDTWSGRVTSKRVCPHGGNEPYDCGKYFVGWAIIKEFIDDPLDNRTSAQKTDEKTAAAN
jgi:hypothetical protein